MSNYTARRSERVDSRWKRNEMYRRLKQRTLSDRVSGLVQHRERIFAAGDLGPATDCSLINPGALTSFGNIYAVLRGEHNHDTWLGRWDASRATPILCVLNMDLALQQHSVLTYQSLPLELRAEDWRLFELGGHLYANHSVYFEHQGSLWCRLGISALNPDDRSITFISLLQPPTSTPVEDKNWGFFVHDKSVLSIYSIEPYTVVKVDIATGELETIVRDSQLDRFNWIEKRAPFVSNSTNPIEWDDENYITFVHDYLEPPRRYQRDRVYMQYGMLIDKSTLLPSSIIPDPLLIGGRENGLHPGVHYTTSLVLHGEHLFAFYGEGDSHTGVVVFNRSSLWRQFSLNMR
jgi:hypothetical protein